MFQKKKSIVSFLTVSIPVVLIFFLLSSQAVYASSGTILKSGMRSDAVLQLQKDLKKLNYLEADPTGYFGDATSAAVKELQKEYGLDKDGIAGEKTLALLDRLAGREAAKASRGGEKPLSIVSYAKKFLGVDYVWGGTTPNGFDCSGFLKYVFDKFGVGLNRVSRDQATQGSRVAKGDLKPGDLVFFDTNGGNNRINHVGMYIGNGKFIQASSEYGGVLISNLTDGFYADAYMTARRVLK